MATRCRIGHWLLQLSKGKFRDDGASQYGPPAMHSEAEANNRGEQLPFAPLGFLEDGTEAASPDTRARGQGSTVQSDGKLATVSGAQVMVFPNAVYLRPFRWGCCG